MNTPTPPPRLVPDRPSDAAIAQAFRQVHELAREHHAGAAAFVDSVAKRAREIDAAAPPAEAPANLAAIIDSMEHDAADIRLGRQWMSACEHYLPQLRALAAAPAAPADVLSPNYEAGFKAGMKFEAEQQLLAPNEDPYAWGIANGSEDGDEDVVTRSHAVVRRYERAGFTSFPLYTQAPRVTGGREEQLREALADLLSWFPDKPVPAEWRLPAGTHGADDAITAAHDALGHKTCRFCEWRGVPETAADPYTTDGTVEVCGGCNNAESCA